MSIPLPSYFLPHTVKIAESNGSGSMGPIRGSTRDAAAFVIDGTETVVGADGTEDVSSARVTVNLDDPAQLRDAVTLWPGTVDERSGRVIRIERGAHPDLPSFKTLFVK